MCGCGSEEGRKVTESCSCERCGFLSCGIQRPFHAYKRILFRLDNALLENILWRTLGKTIEGISIHSFTSYVVEAYGATDIYIDNMFHTDLVIMLPCHLFI